MGTRRSFLKTSAAGGLAGILASGRAPAFAQDMNLLKIGQIGLGGHNFALSFQRHREEYKDIIRAKPYGFWDDYPGVNERFGKKNFEKVFDDPADLARNCDVVCVEYADYRKVLELSQPALEAGLPVFYDRPFTGSIYSAERIVELAREHDAPIMACSSLELQPEIPEIQQWVKDNGPVRSYECYCPEPMFQWMFPHTINFAHAAIGGGIDTAYFAGDYVIEMGNIKSAGLYWYDDGRELGDSVSLLTYKPRDGQPPIIGMNHIGPGPGTYNIFIYTVNESRNFIVGEHLDDPKIFLPMFLTLNEFFVERKPPRPYDAILEMHRAHVATNVSRLTGRAVSLDQLGGDDSLPWSPSVRDWLLRVVLD